MDTKSIIDQMNKVRQTRIYLDKPVSDADLTQLLEIARWTGSAKNVQPWQFIVIRDPAVLKTLASLRPPIIWLADVPMAIAIVLDGDDALFEAFDEGRLFERVALGATLLGLGAGTAWFPAEAEMQQVKDLLGVPQKCTLHSVIGIGYPDKNANQLPGRNYVGRKPLAELVSYEKMGHKKV